MRVICENCSTNFNLNEGLVKSAGSKVRCSKCKHIFVVHPAPPKAEGEDAEEKSKGSFGGGAADAQEQLDTGAGEKPDTGTEEGLEKDTEKIVEAVVSEGLDLSDIENMLEIEKEPDIMAPAGEDLQLEIDEGEDGEHALDLSDIEKILDDEGGGDELMEEKSDEEQDLVFDLVEETESELGSGQISPTTELDLGDLEKMFEAEDEFGPEEEASAEELGEDDELPGLDLEGGQGDEALADFGGEEASALDIDIKDEDLVLDEQPGEAAGEDIGLAIETEGEPEAPIDELEGLDLKLEEESEASAGELEELDLKLEEESETPSGELEELDLKLEIESEAPSGESEELDLKLEEESETSSVELEELDLKLEDESEAPSDELEELDIEIEVEPEVPADEGVSGGEPSDIVLEAPDDQQDGVEDLFGESITIEPDEDEPADADEDAELEYPDDAVPDIPDEDDFEEGAPEEAGGAGAESLEEIEEDVDEIASGGGLKKVIIGIVAAIVFVVLVIGVLLALQSKGVIHLSLLDRVFSTQAPSGGEDLGNLKIKTLNVNDTFLENEKAGRIFVITGTVKNEYSGPRSYILVSGKLYTKDKALADTAAAYCGNVISDLELSQMTPDAVRTRLGNRSGDSDSNIDIKPGEERPFMIVFFDLPEELDQFTVAVEGSTAGSR